MRDREDLRRTTFEAELAGVRQELFAFCRHMLWRGRDVEDILQEILYTASGGSKCFSRGRASRPGSSRSPPRFSTGIESMRGSARSWLPGKMNTPTSGRIRARNELRRTPPRPRAAGRGSGFQDVVAIEQLGTNERAVLLLRILGGFSTAETGGMLSMPGSVMGFLGRARRKLRLSLADYARKNGILRSRKGAAPR